MNTYNETVDSNYIGGTLSAFVVGAALGAAAALILAPATGRDTRPTETAGQRAWTRCHGARDGKLRAQSERRSRQSRPDGTARETRSTRSRTGEAAYREARESFGETRQSVTDSERRARGLPARIASVSGISISARVALTSSRRGVQHSLQLPEGRPAENNFQRSWIRRVGRSVHRSLSVSRAGDIVFVHDLGGRVAFILYE